MSEPKPPVPYQPGKYPERRVSSEQLEAVIRRATELESASGGGGDALSEEEVLRIGRELGIAPIHVRQALAEVGANARPAEPGVVARVMGPGYAGATRVVQGDADEVRGRVERYLLEVEHMVIERQFADFTRYRRGTGLGTAIRRTTTQLQVRSRFAEFKLKELDVGIQPLEDGYSLVTVGVNLAPARAGMLGGGLAVGTALGTGAGTFAAIAIDPFLGIATLLPLVAAGGWGMRPIYRNTFKSTEDRLEAFLDRVQSGDLPEPPKGDWKKKLGL